MSFYPQCDTVKRETRANCGRYLRWVGSVAIGGDEPGPGI